MMPLTCTNRSQWEGTRSLILALCSRGSQNPAGVPVLSECAAWRAGRVVDRMSVGDHEAFITVTERGAGSHQGRFMMRDAGDFEPGHPE